MKTTMKVLFFVLAWCLASTSGRRFHLSGGRSSFGGGGFGGGGFGDDFFEEDFIPRWLKELQDNGWNRQRRWNRPRPQPRPPAPGPAPYHNRRQRNTPTGNAKQWLDVHNVFRCMHGVRPLQWSSDVAAYAQRHADRGRFQHSRNPRSYDYPWPAGPSGENLGKGHQSMSQAIKSWYSEIANCPRDDGAGCSYGTRHVSNQNQIGHYTVMVWKGATHLGCGVNGNLYVCNYRGPRTKSCDTPNMKSYNGRNCYPGQVLGARKSRSQCQGYN